MKIYWDGLGLDGNASGVFTHALSIAKALNSFGVRPTVLSYSKLTSDLKFYVDSIEVSSQPIYKIFPKKFFFPSFTEKRVIKKEKEVNSPIIFHGLSNLNLGILNTKDKNLRYVVTVHDLIPLLQPGGTSLSLKLQTQFLLPKVLRRADLVVTVSEWTKNKILDHFNWIDPNKIVVIPNGRPQSIKELRSLSFFEKDVNPTLLCVSRGESYKRLDLLCSIFRILKLKIPNIKLTVITDRSGKKLVEQKGGSELGIKCLVNVSPAFLKEHYEKSSLLVHPSLMEGYGLPIIEAISNGTKAVFTSGSSMDSFYTKAYTRSLNKTASPEEWAQQINSFLQEASDTALVLEAKKFYESMPTWNQVASKLYCEYQKLIS